MRDFYERQEHAEEESFYLSALLFFSTLLTVSIVSLLMAGAMAFVCFLNAKRAVGDDLPEDYFQTYFLYFIIPAATINLAIVVGTMIYRMWEIGESGGPGVAEALGAKRIFELDATQQQRVVLNICDELAIATGIRRPAIFIIEDDMTINGLAAGWTEKDAVIALTRGAVDKLSREQLQGILAHEYSHIIKKDIVLNTRLIGALSGLRALSSMAAWCLRGGVSKPSALSSNPASMGILIFLGMLIRPVGKLGELLAKVIVFAVTRQREFLADARAVEITRNPFGLRERSKKCYSTIRQVKATATTSKRSVICSSQMSTASKTIGSQRTRRSKKESSGSTTANSRHISKTQPPAKATLNKLKPLCSVNQRQLPIDV